MVTKRRNLFLYLTLACFLGLLAIFVVDGYMGIYDTVHITAGEQSWTVEADVWLRGGPSYGGPVYEPVRIKGDKIAYYIPANRTEKVFFRYEIDNRRFSTYTADVEVAVWHSQEKVRDLVSQPISISAFDKGQLEWVVDNAELLPGDIPPEQSYNYTVRIEWGEIERRVVVYINPLNYPPTPR